MAKIALKAVRRKLSTTRGGTTRQIKIHGSDYLGAPKVYKVYLTTGKYPDGTLGEIFIRIGKAGSTTSGTYDLISTLFSIALQHGVPLDLLLSKMRGVSFEPSGPTGDSKLGIVKSIPDAVAKCLGV